MSATETEQFDTPSPFSDKGSPEMRAADAAKAADDERKRRWAPKLYALDDLDGLSEPWARKAVLKLRRSNAGLDPVKRGPSFMVEGGELVKAGASDAQLASLPALSATEQAELRFRAAVYLEAARLDVREHARRQVRDRAGATAERPSPLSLTDLLAEPDDAVNYRIDGLLPIGGRVLLAAQYKSGKSTLVGNAIRTLVDGGQFLGQFATMPVGKVVLLDTELDTRTLRRWLRDQGVQNTDAVTVLSLRGKVSSFDILDPSIRAEWVELCRGADVVVLDCLRPVLDALGLSEDKDAGRLLVALDQLLADAGAGEALLVTHMGHNGERARGDSRLLDWPDALWKIVRDPNAADGDNDAKRYLSAIGRDVSLAEGELSFDVSTRHLAYLGGNRRDAGARTVLPDLLKLLRDEPGRSGREIETALMNQGAARNEIRDALKLVRKECLVRTERGPRNALLHYIIDGDPLA